MLSESCSKGWRESVWVSWVVWETWGGVGRGDDEGRGDGGGGGDWIGAEGSLISWTVIAELGREMVWVEMEMSLGLDGDLEVLAID